MNSLCLKCSFPLLRSCYYVDAGMSVGCLAIWIVQLTVQLGMSETIELIYNCRRFLNN